MKFNKLILPIIIIFFISSCANYNPSKINKKSDKKYFTTSGFIMIYEDSMYQNKIVNKKIDNAKIIVLHNYLKVNTPIKIINPQNQLILETKIHKRADYPKIFKAVFSKEVASLLKLDINDPYVELIEIKKNKKFVAKKSNTFDEEKNVAEKAPVDEIEMNDLSSSETISLNNNKNKKNFIIVINDFYYEDSAKLLLNELVQKNKMVNVSLKKMNNTKYRLLAGPFKNFNALKNTYISLNNLGFEDLDILYSE